MIRQFTGVVFAGALAMVALPVVPGSPAAAFELSPGVARCVQEALGDKAKSLIQGGDKAMARLSSRDRGRIEGCLLTDGRASGSAAKKPPKLAISPMDPLKVTSMSKFRSCAGHDFSGANLQGQSERDRSMKHYLYVDVPWTATGAVQVRAPFAGTAIVTVEENYPLGSWVRILSRSGWAFTAFHVDPEVRNGQKVSAGDVVAAFPPANAPTFMPDRMNEPEANFDFSLQSTDGRLTSFVDWLSPTAGKGWADRGFTSQALTISRQERDALQCAPDYPDGPGTTGFVAAK